MTPPTLHSDIVRRPSGGRKASVLSSRVAQLVFSGHLHNSVSHSLGTSFCKGFCRCLVSIATWSPRRNRNLARACPPVLLLCPTCAAAMPSKSFLIWTLALVGRDCQKDRATRAFLGWAEQRKLHRGGVAAIVEVITSTSIEYVTRDDHNTWSYRQCIVAIKSFSPTGCTIQSDQDVGQLVLPQR